MGVVEVTVRTVVAHSEDPDSGYAAVDLIRQLDERLEGESPSAFLVFSCCELDHSVILQKLHDRFGDVATIGGTTDGELSSTIPFAEDSIVVVAIVSDHARFRSSVACNIGTNPENAAIHAANEIADGDDVPSLCIVLTDGLSPGPSAFVEQLNAALPSATTLIGGTSGDQWLFKKTHQFHGTRVYQDAVVLLAVYGDFHFSFARSAGWTPVGPEMIVTSSDGDLVCTIDGRPTVEVYEEYFGIHSEPSVAFPLLVTEKGASESYLRAPVTFHRDTGVVQYAGAVPSGATIQLAAAEQGDIINGARMAMTLALDSYPGTRPSGALVFSCAARKQVLGTSTGEEVQAILSAAPNLSTAGFYTYGEIAPLADPRRSHLHNETVVALLIGQ